ncbi:PKD domain-containing protein [Chitinophaga pinensis]|uniref:PKD domain-containing protein n=1 Tax=Chitinophaga pinensis TaxID=79329 RepID=UPI0021BDB70C|nr:PKD domain-containing protein [Chitinophaga pinensis]
MGETQTGFTASPPSCMPLEVKFTDKSDPVDGTITTYTWDFGDGALATAVILCMYIIMPYLLLLRSPLPIAMVVLLPNGSVRLLTYQPH